MSNLTPILFARADSIYKQLPGTDVWDADRNALNCDNTEPGVYHPPCRAWGAFAMFANPRPGERELAIWSVWKIRKYGGVLEHPAASKLWPEMGLPRPGQRDEYGGFTVGIHQSWFGHKAEKKTLLYIVGIEPRDLPDMPMDLSYPTHVIGDVGRASNGTKRPEISKAEREHTPIALAEWLVALARKCRA